MRLPNLLLLTLFLSTRPLMAAEVHQHGVAQLDMVLEPPLLAIAFSSPLANLVGFEHQPASANEQKIWQQTQTQLQHAEELIRLPTEADCSLSRVDLHLPFTAQNGIQSSKHDHGHAHIESISASHADLMAEYQYLCANSGMLQGLELTLMDKFPAIERLDIQLITPSAQHRLTLNAGQTGLQLP